MKRIQGTYIYPIVLAKKGLLLVLLIAFCCIGLSKTGTGQTISSTNHKSSIDKNSILWKYIESLPVIDTHEHMRSESELLGKKVDVFDLFTPYIVDNLQAAGMTVDEMWLMNNKQADFQSRWEVFNQYYRWIKNTSYFLAVRRSLEDQFQLESVSLNEFQRISDLLTREFATKGFVKKYMDLNKIESILAFRSCSMKDVHTSYGSDNVSVVPTVSHICVRDANSLKTISNIMETEVKDLDDVLEGLDKLFRVYDEAGITNIKFGSAYYRSLNYQQRTRAEAEESFAKIIQTDFNNYKRNTPLKDYHIPLEDYLSMYMISLADKYGMNVIFHVGPAAWNYNTVKNSHSHHLEWLVENFPNVNFVILHAGYPFFDEAVLLAKYYPNVYLNMTWDHIIERKKSIEIMKTYIEMLPTNKIHAFGGDYFYPQQIYGNMIFTKENIYIAFSELITEGTITLEDAKEIAYDWLYANPKSFYYK